MPHIHRFFINERFASGDTVALEAEDFFHAARVLRLRPGDAVELAGAGGAVYHGTVSSVGGAVKVAVDGRIEERDGISGLTVVQALPRGRRLDLVVEKLSELGVERLVPVVTGKSVSAPAEPGEKSRRWRRIARAAAAQARRSSAMEVDEPVALGEWLDVATVPVIVLSTENQPAPLGEVLAGMRLPLALVIGPESGFSEAELAAFAVQGAVFGGLGKLVLRTETAALVAATVVLHNMGRLG